MTLMAAAALTGCSNSGHPVCCGPLPVTHIELSAQAGPDGRIEPPEAARTVTLPGASDYLRVDLGIFPGADWTQAGHGNTAVLQDDGPMDHSSPEPCATPSTGCQTGWSEQYQAKAPGTTTLTWTLSVPTTTAPASASPPLPACPTGATAAQLPTDGSCVVGKVTITVIVKS
ncbi:MAG TPA: hypothetical protein VGM10_05570 [Actinocrinis sp.]